MHAVDESSVSRTPLTADWPARTRVSWLALSRVNVSADCDACAIRSVVEHGILFSIF